MFFSDQVDDQGELVAELLQAACDLAAATTPEPAS
jgi:hypothetical protein